MYYYLNNSLLFAQLIYYNVMYFQNNKIEQKRTMPNKLD